MEQEEIWKDIAGYEGLYQVSNMGRVKSVGRTLSNGHKWPEKILKPGKTPTGYHTICLYRNGKQRWETVHRLVATEFIPNNDIFATTVNHKNEVKTDNRVDNLEWASIGDNVRYSLAGPYGKISGAKQYLAKQVRCIETGETFGSTTEASRMLGLSKDAVRNSINYSHRCGGYHWEYVEKDKQIKQQ